VRHGQVNRSQGTPHHLQVSHVQCLMRRKPGSGPGFHAARPRAPAVGEAAACHSALWGCRPTVAPCRSGYVEASGTLQVPDNESFATLAQILGEKTQLRVWWRNGGDWRVDRIRATGETDLFREQGYTVRWIFESQTATFSPVPRFACPTPPICYPRRLPVG
jgi:hypothetical protein